MIDFGYYNLDCMIGMKEFPDKFFDLAIVDPPYFSGPERRSYYGRKISPIGVQRLYEKNGYMGSAGRGIFQGVDTRIETSDHMGMQLF